MKKIFLAGFVATTIFLQAQTTATIPDLIRKSLAYAFINGLSPQLFPSYKTGKTLGDSLVSHRQAFTLGRVTTQTLYAVACGYAAHSFYKKNTKLGLKKENLAFYIFCCAAINAALNVIEIIRS